jgi:hypothetical protein
MKVVARQDENRYLVLTEGRLNSNRARGRVLDLKQGILSAQLFVQSILGHGDWKPFEMPDAELQALLGEVTHQPDPAPY